MRHYLLILSIVYIYHRKFAFVGMIGSSVTVF
jgi:hypothetical protein